MHQLHHVLHKFILKDWKKNHVYTMLNAPHLWYSKVVDTFAITSHDLGETFQKLNDIDKNIEFAMEKASEGNSGLYHKSK